MKARAAGQRALDFLRARRPLVIASCAGLVLLALFLRFGLERARDVLQVALEPASLARVESHAEAIRAAAREFDLDPCLLAGMIYVESRGRIDAVSSADALGLMQLTAPAVHDAALALRVPEPTREELLSDAALNVRFGARHFAWTLKHEERDVERALCAYNAGRGRMASWIEAAGSYARWRAKQERDGDSQVLLYARRAMAYAETFRERGHVAGGPGNVQRARPSAP